MFCKVSEEEQGLLLSNRRPIVLLKKRGVRLLSDLISPKNNDIGCMLPYTPLHYLLFTHPVEGRTPSQEPNFRALVMTSGNLAEEPIVHDNDDALRKLAGLVDGYLLHNRDIFMRVDDTVIRIQGTGYRIKGQGARGQGKDGEADSSMQKESSRGSVLLTPHSELSFIRRSRGYAPDPIALSDDGPEVLGCGADLKNTFTLTKGKFAIPSQHIGDMENYETLRFFEECLANLKAVYRAEPQSIVHDLHPGYLSTQWAMGQGTGVRGQGVGKQGPGARGQGQGTAKLKLFSIQHHYAHIGSVMAEHGLRSDVIGVAFDGTGYGTDGQLWGGEFLIAGIGDFDRAGQFRYVPLPGGETAIREPWRTAISYCMQAGGDAAWEYLEKAGFDKRYEKDDLGNVMAVARSRELSPLASGAGRLFDAVSALLGICDVNTFEGEAAMALESFVQDGIEDEYHVEFLRENDYTVVDYSPTIKGIVDDLRRLDDKVIATKFHNTVASSVRTVAGQLGRRQGIQDVALSGGTFQNRYLLNKVLRMLRSDGFNVYTNSKVPCNDACISLGQAYLIRERMKRGK
jgi:hydrogenase maturation protein HypF